MNVAAEPTLHAQQALAFSDIFEARFSPVRYGLRRPRRLELSRLDGPSTAGGRVARQNMVLIPEDPSTSPLVIGWVDATNKRAELRTFRLLGKQFEARHGRGIDLDLDAYEKLESDLQSFFALQKMDLTRADGPSTPMSPDALVETGPRESSWPMLGMLGLGILLGMGIGYLLFGVG